MLYLFWTILNIGLAISFLFISFKAAKALKEKMGVAVSIIFIIGLVALMNNSANYLNIERKDFVFAPAHAHNNDPGNKKISVLLDSSIVFDIELSVLYNISADGILTPVAASSGVTGLEGALTWVPVNIKAEKNDNGIQYIADGNIEWRVFGNKIYTENKNYSGFIRVQ